MEGLGILDPAGNVLALVPTPDGSIRERTIAIGRPDEVANDPAVVEAYLGGASARSA